MKTRNQFKLLAIGAMLLSGLSFVSCSSDDDNNNSTPDPEYAKYTVSAGIDGEGYYTITDDLMSGNISIVGNGSEGWANLSVTVDGYLYILNNTEGLTEKYELTPSGPVFIASIDNGVLTAGAFFRYIQVVNDSEILLLNNPGDSGVPYAIIDLESFGATSYGYITMPVIDGVENVWSNAVVQGSNIYFGSLYSDPDWTQAIESLVTVRLDYPSMTNPEILQSNASAGSTAGYRTNGSFVTENGDIYQYNMTSELWNGGVTDKPSVFVRIKNGNYDDYVFDISAEFNESISIWNAWYAGNGIAYANIVRNSDVPTWGDLLQNTGTIVEINLNNRTVTELNLPKASFRDIFSLDCVEDGKFYIPVSVTGGEAHIYEVNIGGGANGFTQGAKLDGSNVYVNALFKNF
ncbi:hypothetical protein [Formosa sp. A9]|uniref:hypothetical protein n=1 Tax=Formosa sp. A9 TaxID=3442641 RepID=UPI003EC125F2